MTIEHSVITDPNIHEPKGIASASSNEVYVADGGGSGNWTGVKSLSINGLEKVILTSHIVDVSTMGSTFIVVPFACDVEKIYSVIDGALGTGDVTLSFEIGGTAITDGDIVITQSGSAAGDVDSSTPSALNTLSAGQALEIITDGASTNTVRCNLTFILDIS